MCTLTIWNTRQLSRPRSPAPEGLAAHYEFEGTADDSSGNGHHGWVRLGSLLVLSRQKYLGKANLPQILLYLTRLLRQSVRRGDS
jgi:hypothetical protein